jgi:hypothetical protein
VALGISVHVAPKQRSHWSLTDVGVFVQIPCVTFNVWPCSAIPEIAGSDVLAGMGGGVTTAVGAEVAVLLPVKSVAVSTTSIACPTSAAVRV